MTTTRPDAIPEWASDAGYLAPHTGATKTQPSNGYIAQGYTPGEAPSPRHANWLLNALSLRGRYLDGIEVKNWHTAPTRIGGTELTSLGFDVDIAYSPSEQAYYVFSVTTGPSSGIRRSGPSGRTWLSQAVPGTRPGQYKSIVASDTHVFAAGNSVTSLSVKDIVAGTWSNLDITGLALDTGNVFGSAIWRGSGGEILIGFGGSAAHILRSNQNNTARSRIVLATPSGYTASSLGPDFLIGGNGDSASFTLALLGRQGGTLGGGLAVYKSNVTGTAFTGPVRLDGSDIAKPLFSTLANAWTAEVGTQTRYYIQDVTGRTAYSFDGDTWTELVGTVTPMKRKSIAALGTSWVGVLDSTGELAYSLDHGVTWTPLLAPFDDWQVAVFADSARGTIVGARVLGSRIGTLAKPTVADKDVNVAFTAVIP